jgi:hypothetical protein
VPACHIARALGDDVAWDELTARQVELARRTGALSLLPVALDDRTHADLFCGRLAAAVSDAAEAEAVVDATGSPLTLRGPSALAIWRGQVAETLALIESRRQDVLRRGEGFWLASSSRSAPAGSSGRRCPTPASQPRRPEAASGPCPPCRSAGRAGPHHAATCPGAGALRALRGGLPHRETRTPWASSM